MDICWLVDGFACRGLSSVTKPASISTKIRTDPLIRSHPPPSRSAGDRRAASSSGRAQTESGSGGSVPVGGAPRLSAPPHDCVLLVALLLPRHGLQPHAEPQLCRPHSSRSPLHPTPPAPVSRRAALRHTEPGELRQHGHQCVHGEQLGLLAR